jgi:small subunit ribosomal protein S4
MARELDFQCKMCRREGIKLYLKGTRCDSPKCAIERRNQSPGMHWQRRGKQSEYGLRLREKQKLKRFYGVLERQFRRYFALASRSTENTGEALISIMERRLDNVVHRLGWAPSRVTARQLVGHGHVTVNGKACDVPSMLLKAGDKVEVKNRTRSVQLVKLYMTQCSNPVPDFLTRSEGDPPSGSVLRLPSRLDIDPRLEKDKPLREQLIIEVAAR